MKGAVTVDRTWKIAFACGLGALIGTAIALDFMPWLSWTKAWPLWLDPLIGMLAGGAIGYLAYEWHEIPIAIKRAWRVVKPALRQLLPSRIEDPLVREGRFSEIGVWGVVATYFTMAWSCALMFDVTHNQIFAVFTFLTLVTGGLAIILAGATVDIHDWLLYPHLDIRTPSSYPDKIEVRKCLVKYGNPLMVFVGWPLYGIGWTIYQLIRVSPRIPGAVVRAVAATGKAIPRALIWIWNLAKILALFGWLVFKSIHSNWRVLCLIDAAIGTAIGCLTGSAIIGGIAGAVIGALNYQLVSVRLLKLVPGHAPQ